MAKQKFYEYIDHTADLGIKVYGATLEELFINIAKAVFETQIEGSVESKKETKIKITSETLEDLFIDWCRELIYNFSVQGFIPKKYEISIDDFTLTARLFGDVFDTARHKVNMEIKNPTYHNLHIEKAGEHYSATIIFDV